MISLSRPQPKSCCFCVGIPLPNTTVYQALYNMAPGFSLTSSPATVPVFPLSPPCWPLALLKHANAPRWCFSSLYSASSRAPLPCPIPRTTLPSAAHWGELCLPGTLRCIRSSVPVSVQLIPPLALGLSLNPRRALGPLFSAKPPHSSRP